MPAFFRYTDFVTRERFEREVEKNRDRLFRHCRKLVSSTAEAEDLLQDTIVRGLGACGKFQGKSSMSTWLYRIATNLMLDGRKKAKCRPQTCDEGDTAILIADDRLPDTLERLTIEETICYLRARLPRHMWEIMRLYHLTGLNYDQIGALLDVPLGTVKSRLNRARIEARRLLLASESVAA